MLVTTFKDDIKQFHMFCYCLAKNWQGNKDLIVCLGKNDDESAFKKITDEVFDSSWKIEIKPTLHAYGCGPTEQQVNTLHYSVNSGADDILVWDCKDFLLRPCDISAFKKGNKYRHTYVLLDQKISKMGYDLDEIVDGPIDHYPAISNIRPWLWNVALLSRLWTHLNTKFGDCSTWKIYPGLCEIYSYYLFALKDPMQSVEFLGPEETPLMFAGGWTHQTYEGILQQVKEFDQWEDRIVWKHSRKLEDPRCLDVTKSMLLKYGITQEILDRVYG
jgi:hypothetical protein